MSDTAHALSEEPDDDFERLMEKHAEPTPEVADALTELQDARANVSESLDQLASAAQSALDIPAKFKRNPVKTAALIGGTGFLVVGGPRRVVRAVGRRILPQPRPDRNAGILPTEIEKVLKDTGLAKDPEVRRALNKDFAEYLRQKGDYSPERNAAASFWRTFDKVAGPLGTAGARVMVQRLMEAEKDRAFERAEVRASVLSRGLSERSQPRASQDDRSGAEGGTRTPTPFRALAPKASVSAVSPLPRAASVRR